MLGWMSESEGIWAEKDPTRDEWGIYHSIFEPLFLLHFQHNVCKFSSVVKPPFDKGIIWSISKSK